MRKLSIILLFFLTACSNNHVYSEKNETTIRSDSVSEKTSIKALNRSAASLPNKMPSDFNFSIEFGIGSKNKIDTFKNIVQKDLISNGIVTTNLKLTQDEMGKIYQQMKDIKIMDSKNLTPEQLDCITTPFETDKWVIQVAGETKKLEWSGQYCQVTEDAKELLALRKSVFELIKSKKEYTNLPDVKGGYQ
jgi:hypothetical protein